MNFLNYNKQKVLDNAGTISHFDERLSDYLVGKEE